MNDYLIKDLMCVNRGSSPRPILDYLSDFGYRWLKISDFKIYDKYVYETKEFIKESGLKNTKHLPSGTLILTNSATPGIPIFLGKDMCLHDGFLYFTNINEEIINKNYLYYWFIYNRNLIVNQANGSVFKNLKKEIVENFKIEVPDYNIQLKTIRILDNINNKINQNNEINNNLYELINYIYKETFKDYQTYKRIDEVSNVTIGKTPPRSEQECFTNNKNDIKWISISDLGKSGVFIYDTNEKLKKDAVEKYNIKVIPEDTIILSFKLTVGRVGITTEDMTTNEAIAHFDLYNKKYKNYLYCMLKNYNYNDLGSTSSIATAINSKIVKSMKIGIPYDNDLEKFNNLTFSMFDLIKLNEKNNIYLEQLRDALLPKLMSGEIDLDNIEI